MDTTCKNCSSLPTTGSITQDGCSICSNAQGFLFIPFNSTCVICSSLFNTNGSASLQGCGCVSPYVWSSISYACITNPCSGSKVLDSTTETCVCDFTKAILDGLGNCILCSSYANSNNVPVSQSACGCAVNYVWTYVTANNNGSCICSANCGNCDLASSVMIGALCYNCSKV